MWNGTMFVDLDWPLNASSLLSASAELLVRHYYHSVCVKCRYAADSCDKSGVLQHGEPQAPTSKKWGGASPTGH